MGRKTNVAVPTVQRFVPDSWTEMLLVLRKQLKVFQSFLASKEKNGQQSWQILILLLELTILGISYSRSTILWKMFLLGLNIFAVLDGNHLCNK